MEESLTFEEGPAMVHSSMHFNLSGHLLSALRKDNFVNTQLVGSAMTTLASRYLIQFIFTDILTNSYPYTKFTTACESIISENR
jgi:hypothetical protein